MYGYQYHTLIKYWKKENLKLDRYLISRVFNFQQKILCAFVDVSERVVLLSRHKIDDKEDITL